MPNSPVAPLQKSESALRFIWRFLRPDRKTVLVITALLVINNGFSLVEPYLFKVVIDKYLTHLGDKVAFPDESVFIHGLFILLLIWIGVAFISRVAKNFQDFFTTMVSDRAGIRVFDFSFKHVLGLSMDYHESKKTGEVMRKLSKAREDITKLIKILSDKILQNSATILFVVVFTFLKEWRMGLVLAAAIPTFVITTSLIARKIKRLAIQINKQQESLQGTAVQALDHISVVKAFRTEGRESDTATNNNWQANAYLATQTRYWRTLGFVQGTLINFFRTAIVGYGTYLAFRGIVTPGDVVFFTFYAVGIFMPLYELSDVYTAYQDGIASTERLREILDTPSSITSPPHGHRDDRQAVTVAFDRVAFAYTPDRPILKDIFFTLTPGKKLAIVGGSGGGKSTITKLVLRYYDVTSGAIMVNGVDIRTWELDSLRQRMAVVFQDNILFNDTIAKNIAYGSPNATTEEIITAAKLANAHEFIMSLPDQYESMVGERGIKLSGGERQRVAIARAVIQKPALYIFDEATSSLDSRSERLVQDAIDHVSAGVASLTIAHRLSTVVNADEIIVLMEGRIVERGRHTDLIAQNGEYAKLYATQRHDQAAVPELPISVSLAA